MRKKSGILIKTFLIVGTFLAICPNTYLADSDFSAYRIETGDFKDVNEAKKSLDAFKKVTGWNGEYVQVQDYQIKTGYFNGEEFVKDVLMDFKRATGINATYEGWGTPENYYQIVTGFYNGVPMVEKVMDQLKAELGINSTYKKWIDQNGFYRIESGFFNGYPKTKEVLEDFKKLTGLKATYKGWGTPENYYRIISGYYNGVAKVKEVIQDFKNETGINATYQGWGTPDNYYWIISGYYNGLAKIKEVIKNFEKETGIKATYEPLGKNRYQLKSVPVLGLSKTKAGEAFFKKRKWNVYSKPTGQKGYTKFQLVSDPVLGNARAKAGEAFFKKRKWNVYSKPTGQKGYTRFYIVADSVLGKYLNKGIGYFTQKKWKANYKAIDPRNNNRYQIVTEPILGMSKVNKGLQFFTQRKWKAQHMPTGKAAYTKFIIKSSPITGLDRTNKALKFFTDKKWKASSVPVSSPYYQIVTEKMFGYDNAVSLSNKIKNLFKWKTSIVKTNNVIIGYTNYGLSLEAMLNIQMSRKPQTDKYRNEPRYIHSDYVDLKKQIVTGDRVNVRTGPSLSSLVTQQVNRGTKVQVIRKIGDWVEIRMTWQNATANDVRYYLDPKNFPLGSKGSFQFIKLSQHANSDPAEINKKLLNNKGILSGKGEAFIKAAKTYNINEIYLISHALLETGNGTSALARGVKYNGKTVYNVYGYGAYDSCPVECGAKFAYEHGWFSIDQAIIDGARLIDANYINNSVFPQDTIYKMRWNPIEPWHQYATDVAWAFKQVHNLYQLYMMLDSSSIYFDLPRYK